METIIAWGRFLWITCRRVLETFQPAGSGLRHCAPRYVTDLSRIFYRRGCGFGSHIRTHPRNAIADSRAPKFSCAGLGRKRHVIWTALHRRCDLTIDVEHRAETPRRSSSATDDLDASSSLSRPQRSRARRRKPFKRRSWCGRPDSNRHRPFGPKDFRTSYGFRRRQLVAFVVWTIPSP